MGYRIHSSVETRMVMQGKYFINENEAPAIRYAFNVVKDGVGYDQIIENLSVKYNKKISKGTLRFWLQQPKYVGTYVYGKERFSWNPDRVLDKTLDEIRNENGIPAIVDKELYDEVQAILNGRKGKSGQGQNRDKHPLNDKLFCKICGKSMRGARNPGCGRNKSLYIRYECLNHRAKDNACPTKPYKLYQHSH